jgi:DNA ligase (NAD+)
LALNIDGLGKMIVEQLVDEGLINAIDGLFNLKYESLVELDRMGEKSATNLMGAISQSKESTFARFIYALGIRNVGEHIAKVLEKEFSGNLVEFQKANLEALENIDEIGPIVAETIVQFWSDDSNKIMVQNCLDKGVKLAEIKINRKQPFEDKIFVFTGSLEKLTRRDAKDMVEDLGGKASGSVSKNTDFVVAGPGAGSKLKKAEELGIDILTEEDFLKMVRLE